MATPACVACHISAKSAPLLQIVHRPMRGECMQRNRFFVKARKHIMVCTVHGLQYRPMGDQGTCRTIYIMLHDQSLKKMATVALYSHLTLRQHAGIRRLCSLAEDAREHTWAHSRVLRPQSGFTHSSLRLPLSRFTSRKVLILSSMKSTLHTPIPVRQFFALHYIRTADLTLPRCS